MAKATKRERRIYPGSKIEVRSDDQGKKRICGYAAKFNDFSQEFYGSWVERIAPGAFDAALKNSDVRALFNHDPNIVLGREAAKTLTLTVDDIGLYYEADPPDTQQARDLIASIERGDIDGCSFSFVVAETRWEVLTVNGRDMDVRNILAFEVIYDVGPVTFPAYTSTEVDVRSLDEVFAEKPTAQPPKGDYAARAAALAIKIKIHEKEGGL